MRRRGNLYRPEAGGSRILFGLPATLKALLAQATGWILAILLIALGVLPPQPWPFVLLQCLLAAATSHALRGDRWWIPIHLAFSPLLLFAHGLMIAPGWYLAAFLGLLAVYWTSFRTQVPLFLSNRATVLAVAELLPQGRTAQVLDLGSGTGSLLVPLARLRPDCRFTGLEAAPAPYLLSRLRARGLPNLHFARGDFFEHSWGEQDVVYAFLSPVPMARVWDKARHEIPARAMLISNSFPVPGRKPDKVVEVGDARGTRLFVYNQGNGEKRAN